jgi:hypothetical protein
MPLPFSPSMNLRPVENRIHLVAQNFPGGIMRPWREVDHSPSTTHVKKAATLFPISHKFFVFIYFSSVFNEFFSLIW